MPTYFADVALFDGRQVLEKHGVLVDGAAIAWVGPDSDRSRHEGSELVDGGGALLSPGLIDCHVHLCFDGVADFLGESNVTPPYAAVKCVKNAERHLAAGVTSIRDLGGMDTVVCEVAKAIDEGRVPGPRVIASNQALTISGGHGWNSFARQVDGADGVRRAVREQIRAGARSIKIVATGGVLTPGIPVDFAAFTPEEVEAAVDEAHKWGVPIAAHAIGRTGIEHCVRAGIDSIEHGTQITPEVAAMMKKRGIFRVPTISALRGIIDNPEEVAAYAVEKGKQIEQEARETFLAGVDLGVPYACGTDAGTPFNPHGNAPMEIVRMVEWGLDPLEALRAATSNAAKLLRLHGVGVIEEGAAADLVLWESNPLDEIKGVFSPRVVMKAGAVVAGNALAE
jgi:imidazolonepropionase-like amidohydrolase